MRCSNEPYRLLVSASLSCFVLLGLSGCPTEPNGDSTASPQFCIEMDYECGRHEDNDGATVNCGRCSRDMDCVEGKCTTCESLTCEILEAVCGEYNDGCGGILNCGTCEEDLSCIEGACVDELCEPSTCQSLGVECGSHSDGCGALLSCGDCPENESCVEGSCVDSGCLPDNCQDLELECGSHDDGCGGSVSCGNCPSGYDCTQGKCVKDDCEPFTCCDFSNRPCGFYDDGCGSSISCGQCPDGKVCIGGQCQIGCTPYTCQQLGAQCGVQWDGCGEQIFCGDCDPGYECRGRVCSLACEPETCDAYECGEHDDGCGAIVSCGACADGQRCRGDGVCVTDECLPTSCSELGYECGDLDDGCGGGENCGSCSDGFVCVAGTCLCDINVDGACGEGLECVNGDCLCAPIDCNDINAQCGETHDDGCGGELDCGQCPAGERCSQVGGAWVCECRPKTCEELSMTCGFIPDECDGMICCGVCEVGTVCGGNACVPDPSVAPWCIPDGCPDPCSETPQPGTCEDYTQFYRTLLNDQDLTLCSDFANCAGNQLFCSKEDLTGQPCDSGRDCYWGVCLPFEEECAADSCGSVVDPYGRTQECGDCPTGRFCVNNRCESSCTPAQCPPGECGTIADGCGGDIACLCPSGTDCFNGRCYSCPATDICSVLDAQCGAIEICGEHYECGHCDGNAICCCLSDCGDGKCHQL